MALFFYQTPLGRIGIEEQHGHIINVYFENDPLPKAAAELETPVLQEAFRQLDAYFSGKRKAFDLPLAPSGTTFQKQIWQLLCNIPYGTTASYKDLAIAANNPKAVRAVGQANNKNPIPIFIPCHRVIGANGNLVGYSGGLAMKQHLLSLEGLVAHVRQEISTHRVG